MRTRNWYVTFTRNNVHFQHCDITIVMAPICLKIMSLCIVHDQERRGGVRIQVADIVYPFQSQLLTHQTLFVLCSVCLKRVIFVITHNIINKGTSWHIHIFATRQHLPSRLYVCIPHNCLQFQWASCKGIFGTRSKKNCIQCCLFLLL
jgi:hypothetical protein